MSDWNEWDEAEINDEANRSYFERCFDPMNMDSKKRRRTHRKKEWPGKKGITTRKRAPRPAPAHDDGEGGGWTCVVWVGDEEVMEFHHQNRVDCKRAMRAFIRTSLHKSVRTATQEEGDRKTIVRFAKDD